MIVTIRSYLSSYTGYGQTAEHLGRQLAASGVEVRFDPYRIDEHFAPVGEFVRSHMDSEPGDVALQITTPDHIYDRRLPTVYFTMWESTALPSPEFTLPYLNGSECVVTTSRWNIENFRRNGVEVPIHFCPLGITRDFFPEPIPYGGPTIFGMAGRLNHGGVRKGFKDGIAAFRDAFPRGDEDVILRVKVWEDDLRLLGPLEDERIRILTTPMSFAAMRRWYHGITCLFVPSKSEGWGMHTHQAMACGRPVIACDYSGTREFWRPELGWALDYDEAPAEELYDGAGLWAVPRHESMVHALRAAHANRDACQAKGRAGIAPARAFSWENAGRHLLAVLASTLATSEV